MGKSRTYYHPKDKHTGIPITFTGHKKLSAGATARKGECQTCHDHAREIPEALGMRDRLAYKPRMKLT